MSDCEEFEEELTAEEALELIEMNNALKSFVEFMKQFNKRFSERSLYQPK